MRACEASIASRRESSGAVARISANVNWLLPQTLIKVSGAAKIEAAWKSAELLPKPADPDQLIPSLLQLNQVFLRPLVSFLACFNDLFLTKQANAALPEDDRLQALEQYTPLSITNVNHFQSMLNAHLTNLVNCFATKF